MTADAGQPTAALICPKCRGNMRAYERSGVTIDQCEECRGIFLDRGEMERLLDAEAAFATPQQQPAPQQQAPPPQYPPQPQYAPPPPAYQVDQYGQPVRPRGFLDSLFGDHHGGGHGGYRRHH